MARVKVTGYFDTEDNESIADESHPMGITDTAYTAFVSGQRALPQLEDLEFELEDNDDVSVTYEQFGAAKKARKL